MRSIILVAVATISYANNLLKDLPLSTQGTKIVDTRGHAVRLACANWYGAHLERYVVNGLDENNLDTLSKMMVDQGFNCVRLPFSLEMYYKNPVVSDSALSANSHLKGKKALDIFDKTVESLTNAGLAVVLNNHISDATWCCSADDSNGLWHNKNYSAEQWHNAVVEISERYKENKLVIGNDLRNEIRDDTKNLLHEEWGTGHKRSDWALAATECGNELLKRVPDSLVIVEGLQYANNLHHSRKHPIKLDVPNKLVMSFHLYPWDSIFKFDTYDNFKHSMYRWITFILDEDQEYTAPLWLGEFGTNTGNNYWHFMVRWLEENPHVGWAYWAWNGYQHKPSDHESYGIMRNDMKNINQQWVLDDLHKINSQPKRSSNSFDTSSLQEGVEMFLQ